VQHGILDQERHPRKSGPGGRLIDQGGDILLPGFHHGPDRRIDAGQGGEGQIGQFTGIRLALADKLGQTQRVVFDIVGKLHGTVS
jgi:hypothetical protein